jgi:hypothetical protein
MNLSAWPSDKHGEEAIPRQMFLGINLRQSNCAGDCLLFFAKAPNEEILHLATMIYIRKLLY